MVICFPLELVLVETTVTLILVVEVVVTEVMDKFAIDIVMISLKL